MKNRFLSLMLALCMILSLCIPALAAAPSAAAETPVSSGGTGASEVTLAIGDGGTGSGNGAFSVTVPTVLPFVVRNDGTVLAATDGKIKNYSLGPVEVSGVTGSGINGWSIVEEGTDFTRVHINTKAFTMDINGDSFLAAATGAISNLPLTAANWPVINGGSNLPILYEGEFAIQDSNITGQIANVVFFVQWHRDPASVMTGLQIQTVPTKSAYLVGEDFDPDGMIVCVGYGDGSYRTVGEYTVVNGTDLTYGQTSVTIRYEDANGTVSTTTPVTVARAVSGIEITGDPTTTEYDAGEDFDPAGLEVTAHFADGSEAVVDDYTITNGTGLTGGQTSVTVSYTSGGQTRTADVAITVNSVGDPRWENITVGGHVKAGTMRITSTDTALAIPTTEDDNREFYLYSETRNSQSSKNYRFEVYYKGDTYYNTEGVTPYLRVLTIGKNNVSTSSEPDLSARQFTNQAISEVTFFGDSSDNDAYNVEWIKINDTTYVCDRVLFVNISHTTLSSLTNGILGYREIEFDGHTFRMRLPTYEECVSAGVYNCGYAPCWMRYTTDYYAFGRAGTDGSPYGPRCSKINGGEGTWLYENYSGTTKVYPTGFRPVLEMVN